MLLVSAPTRTEVAKCRSRLLGCTRRSSSPRDLAGRPPVLSDPGGNTRGYLVVPLGGENPIRVRRGTTGGSKAVRRGVEGPARDRAGVGCDIWLGCCGLVPPDNRDLRPKEARPAMCTRRWDQPWEGGMSGSEPADVAVVQPANLGEGDHITHLGRLNGTRIRAVVVQRPVRSRRVVIRRVAAKKL